MSVFWKLDTPTPRKEPFLKVLSTVKRGEIDVRGEIDG